MNFPPQHCVNIGNLDSSQYIALKHKILNSGAKNVLGREKQEEWTYLGLNEYNELIHYDNHFHYISVDDEPFNNVLSKDWVTEYLEKGLTGLI